jgi:formylglycine-generating enzyme required for sulfatase activity
MRFNSHQQEKRMAEEAVIEAIRMRLRLVPAGCGVLGSTTSELDRDPDEGPQVVVQMSSFWCGVCPVTQAEYSQVMGEIPSLRGGRTHPVTMVSHADALRFCCRLSELTGNVYSLPTEAQWEYACRAGSEDAYCFGSDVELLKDYAWYSANAADLVHPVGQKRMNQWGLCDMHGNVWEWCADLWSANGYELADTHDPVGRSGFTQNIRGGCHYNDPQALRSAKRFGYNATNRFESVGFRVIRAV